MGVGDVAGDEGRRSVEDAVCAGDALVEGDVVEEVRLEERERVRRSTGKVEEAGVALGIGERADRRMHTVASSQQLRH